MKFLVTELFMNHTNETLLVNLPAKHSQNDTYNDKH